MSVFIAPGECCATCVYVGVVVGGKLHNSFESDERLEPSLACFEFFRFPSPIQGESLDQSGRSTASCWLRFVFTQMTIKTTDIMMITRTSVPATEPEAMKITIFASGMPTGGRQENGRREKSD